MSEKTKEKKEKPNRVRTVTIRLNNEELNKLTEFCAVTGMSKSKYIRQIVMRRRVNALWDVTMVNELRRLGGLLKFGITCLDADEQIGERKALRQVLRALENFLLDLAQKKSHSGG